GRSLAVEVFPAYRATQKYVSGTSRFTRGWTAFIIELLAYKQGRKPRRLICRRNRTAKSAAWALAPNGDSRSRQGARSVAPVAIQRSTRRFACATGSPNWA